MSDIRIIDARELKIGDVVQVAVKLRDKQTGNDWWWRSFRCVTQVENRRYVDMLILKLHPTENDLRTVDVSVDVVTKLEEDRWPQGVVAMRMKLIAQGIIKLGQV